MPISILSAFFFKNILKLKQQYSVEAGSNNFDVDSCAKDKWLCFSRFCSRSFPVSRFFYDIFKTLVLLLSSNTKKIFPDVEQSSTLQ